MISTQYQEMIVATLILLILFYLCISNGLKNRQIRFCFFVSILIFYSCCCIQYESNSRYEIKLKFISIFNTKNIDEIIIGNNGKIQFNISKDKDISKLYILKKIELIDENNIVGVVNINKKMSELEKSEDGEKYFFKHYMEKCIENILKKSKLRQKYIFRDENIFKFNIVLEEVKTKKDIEILADDVVIRYIRKGIKFNNHFP